jgi:hypothetical protein
MTKIIRVNRSGGGIDLARIIVNILETGRAGAMVCTVFVASVVCLPLQTRAVRAHFEEVSAGCCFESPDIRSYMKHCLIRLTDRTTAEGAVCRS